MDADPKAQLKQLEQKIDEGRDRERTLRAKEEAEARAIAKLRQDFKRVTGEFQDLEASLQGLEARLISLDAELAMRREALARKWAHHRPVIDGLIRIARYPPEAMIALPGHPADTVRAMLVFKHLESDLRAEAAGIGAELRQIAALQSEAEERRKQQKTTLASLTGKREELQALRAKKIKSFKRAADQRKAQEARNRKIAAKAKDLQDLIKRLERDRAEQRRRAEEAARQAELERRRQAALQAPKLKPLPEPMQAPPALRMAKPATFRDFAPETARLLLPVRGRIIRRYGEKDEYGAASKGILFETRTNTTVVAPFDGEVVFAGPFRGYGQILLIEHGGGYHTLLAGLGQIDSVPGQWLLAREPVATMSDPESDRPRLYVEFRRKGQPINPLPWLADGESKVSG